MKDTNKIKAILYGGATILLANLIQQDDWFFTLYTAIFLEHSLYHL